MPYRLNRNPHCQEPPPEQDETAELGPSPVNSNTPKSNRKVNPANHGRNNSEGTGSSESNVSPEAREVEIESGTSQPG